MSAREQVGRLLALLPYLLANPGARVGDVARLFDVSEQQLLKDLNVAWFSGLPGLAMGDYIEIDMEAAQDEGVISVSNADYLARPLRLGTDEALALLVALRTLAAVPGLPDRGAVDRALAKLEHAAGAAAEQAAAVRVDVDAEAVGEVAATVRQALGTGRRLRMAYWVPARDETTSRDVSPMRLALVDGRLYVEGWCHRAESVRLFRLDRVAQVEVLDAPAELPGTATPRDLSAGLFQPSPDDAVVTLQLEPGARWVAEQYRCESVEEVAAGSLRVTLRAADTRWVSRLMLRLGGAARVVDPPELAASVSTAARAALDLYSRLSLDPAHPTSTGEPGTAG